MARKRYNKKRDCRFDDWRRNDVLKGGIAMTLPLYSSDLDCVEYIFNEGDEITPVALIEKKSVYSAWQTKLPSTMEATLAVARRADVPYYVAVHNDDRSHWVVYTGNTLEEIATSASILDGTLFDYMMFLCCLHKYEPPNIITDALRRVVAINEDGQSIEEIK